MVNSRIALVVCIGAMWGCAAQAEPILTPVEVKVPIPTPVYCEVSKLEKPTLPIGGLNAASSPADTIRAYAATVALLKGAVEERDLELVGCTAAGSRSRGRQNFPAQIQNGDRAIQMDRDWDGSRGMRAARRLPSTGGRYGEDAYRPPALIHGFVTRAGRRSSRSARRRHRSPTAHAEREKEFRAENPRSVKTKSLAALWPIASLFAPLSPARKSG